MNKLTHFFLVLFMICLPATLWADNDKDDDDSRYLAGAVPEVDGRVVFSREFSIPACHKTKSMNGCSSGLTDAWSRIKTIAAWYIKKRRHRRSRRRMAGIQLYRSFFGPYLADLSNHR